MPFPRHLLVAAARRLLKQTNLPPDSAWKCLYYIWEHSLRRGSWGYSDCITNHRYSLNCRTAGRNKLFVFSSSGFLLLKTLIPTDIALRKHSLATWSLELVFLLLQVHWRLGFKMQGKVASDNSLFLSIWMYPSSANSHYINFI